MSDTTEAETDPNFSATRTTVNRGKEAVPALAFSFGTPKRSMVVADLSLGEQFDLVEIAGDNADNTRWMLMAGVAYAVTDLDGMPIPRPTSRQHIKGVLDRIKQDGLSAYFKALKATAGEPQTAESVLDAAKN